MTGTRAGAVAAVLVALAAGSARADGLVTMVGDETTVVGRLGENGRVVVNDALAFVLRREGLDVVPVGAWVEAKGKLVPGARKDGRRVVLRLHDRQLEVLEEDQDTPGFVGALPGEPSPQVARDQRAEHLQDIVTRALEHGRTLQRDDWRRMRRAWAAIDVVIDPMSGDTEHADAVRWLSEGPPSYQVLLTALRAGMPYAVVSRALGQRPRDDGLPDPTRRILTLPASTHTNTGGPELLNAGRWAGRLCNELFEELQETLAELKAALRERVRALNAQDSLTRAQVEEVYDLRVAAAGTAAYGACDAVLTEEGGKAYKAWQASRATGGRARVYTNYLALGGQ